MKRQPWKSAFYLLVCTAFTQNIILAFIVYGWLSSIMKKASNTALHKLSNSTVILDSDYPCLLLRERKHSNKSWKNIFSSGTLNFKNGTLLFFNTSLLLLPAISLWIFAWYAGWNNSFNKGYEQFLVGPLTGIAGILLFSAAMTYIPIAQARQAFNEDWRLFYHFKSNWVLIRSQYSSLIVLSFYFFISSIIFQIIKTLPSQIHTFLPFIEDLTKEELLNFLNKYFYLTSLSLFPLLYFLKKRQASIYAKALFTSYTNKLISKDDLSNKELNTIETLAIEMQKNFKDQHHFIKKLHQGTKKVFISLGLTGTLLIWILFCFQIFAAEFLNYHPKHAWINQPIIQLPYLKYIPNHLYQLEEEDPIFTDPKHMKDNHILIR